MQPLNQKLLMYFGLVALVLFFVGIVLALSSRSTLPPPSTNNGDTNPIMSFPSTEAPQIHPPQSTPQPSGNPQFPQITQARPLTEAQRKSIEESTPYLGDEATHIVADTADYLIYYVGIDDHFSVQLQNIFPTYEHRTSAEREIATALNVPLGEVCRYDVRFTTTPNVAGSVPSDILAPCPQAR